MSDASHLAQRQALKDLNTMARADLEAVWPVLTQGSATELRDGLADVLPALGNGYGNAAAQLGATYYEDLRDLSGAKKPFDPVLPDLPDEGRWGALANWSTVGLRDQEKALWEARLEDQFLGKANPALGKDPGEDARWAVAMEKVYGGLQRSIADQHRLTVVQSSLADPAAQGWARVGVGGSCEFCTMLIGRGEVYSDTTVAFRTHDHCNCSAAPAFSNLLSPPKTFATGLSPKGANTFAAQADSSAAPSSGKITAEQYAAMVPEDKWSQEKRDAILESLHATETGKHLADTLSDFQYGGSISDLRDVIEKRLAGEAVEGVTGHRADAVIDALRHAPSDPVPETLYRGMSVPGDLESVLSRYTSGDDLDLNLTSFSSDPKVAKGFLDMTGDELKTTVMMEFVGDGKVGIPIQNLAHNRYIFKEKEWVSAGKYEIVEVEQDAYGSSVILRIRQKARL